MDLRAIILDNGVQPNAVRQGTRRATANLGGWVMSDETILDEWGSVEVPAAPAAEAVEAAAATTALLVLDIQQGNCNLARRPRCGAATIDELKAMLADAGFTDIRIRTSERSRELIREYVPGSGLEDYVVSATIEAVRP